MHARMTAGLIVGLLAGGLTAARAEEEKAGKPLFNGKDLSGWKLMGKAPAGKNKWRVAGSVKLQQDDAGRFSAEKGDGILLNGDDGKGVNLLSELQHGDCELHLEFNVSKGSNSGVYFQGQYEIQILDSYGRKDSELKYGDCGGVYNHAAPRTNASMAPGEWQTFDVVFRAPRFDAAGKKTVNGVFVKVMHNGRLIHENVPLKKPTTASLPGGERPVGPLMLQGDHGPVAFRNIRFKALTEK